MPFQDPCLSLFLFLLLAGGIVILTKADRTFKLVRVDFTFLFVDFDTINT